MDPDPDKANYSAEYMQRVYQSLLKKGNNISLAELNHSPLTTDDVAVANPSQIRQTVKIIQSNGASRAEITPQKKTSAGSKAAQSPALVPVQAPAPGPAPTPSGSKAGQRSVSIVTTPSRGESCIMGYKKRQQVHKHRKQPNGSIDPHYYRWTNLKKYVKQMVFMNAAFCDEVVRYEEKLAKAREERRFLLRKLLHYQSMAETQSAAVKQISASLLKSSVEELMTGIKSKTSKKKQLSPPSGEMKKRQTKDMLETFGVKPKPKKSKVSGGKHVVPPIPLDSIGRPIFPLVIGDLTLHSVGEIVPDRPGFHTSNSIFPVGYCSTRVYASVQDLDRQCLYTCKISDGGTGPMFEIVQEDSSEAFKSRFLSECHSQLLRAINHARGTKVVDTTGKGPDFFGLSHPLVQNLIQSCPGAKKCNGYKWMKFEVNKTLTIESTAATSNDPSISQHSLRAKLLGVTEQSPSNLRSLLTGAVPDAAKLAS